MPLNGSKEHRSCKTIVPHGEILIARHRRTETISYGYFMQSLSQEHLPQIVHMASEDIKGRTERDTTEGEISKHFGNVILMTRASSTSPRSL